MTLRRRMPVLFAACLTLAGCATPIVQKTVGTVMGTNAATAPMVKPGKDAPQIWMTMVSLGIKFPMSQLQVRDGVTIYASKDGSQAFMRNGILIGTRGFGRDLMSAEAPSAATLRAGAPHQRSYYDMDGTDTMFRHRYACTVARDPADAGHVTEDCTADIGSIRNQFWFDSADSISKSRQWVSQGVGYVAVERKAK